MPIQTLQKIWLACAMILLITCMDFLSAIQGWEISFGTKLFLEFKLSDWDSVEASVRALTIVLPILVLVCALAVTHAKRLAGSPSEKFPFRLLDISADSKDGSIIQVLAFCLFLLLPFYCVGLFSSKISNYGCVFLNGTGKKMCLPDGIWSSQDLDWRLWDNSIRIHQQGEASNGVTFEPVIQPLLALGFIAIALISLVRLLVIMFRKSAQPKPADSQ